MELYEITGDSVENANVVLEIVLKHSVLSCGLWLVSVYVPNSVCLLCICFPLIKQNISTVFNKLNIQIRWAFSSYLISTIFFF